MTEYVYVAPVNGVWAPRGNNVFEAHRDYSRRGGTIAERLHSGNDLIAANGSPVVATIGGRVIYTGNNAGYGANVVVLGDDGNVYRYAMHDAYSVKLGDEVAQGAKLGTIGRGHLHFEVIPPEIDGVPNKTFDIMVDPNTIARNQFIDTQTWKVGNQILGTPTIDPMKFFGMSQGEELALGNPIGDPNRRQFVAMSEDTPGADPFGVGGMKADKSLVANASPEVKKLAGMMLGEAKVQGAGGMLRVGYVAQNRADDQTGKFPNSLDAVLSKGQFSGLKNGVQSAKLYNATDDEWAQAIGLAQGIVDHSIPDPTKGALFFATPSAVKNNSAGFARDVASKYPSAGKYTANGYTHLFYGKVSTPPTPVANTAATVPQFGQYLRDLANGGVVPGANLRTLAEANWAAEAQSPQEVPTLTAHIVSPSAVESAPKVVETVAGIPTDEEVAAAAKRANVDPADVAAAGQAQIASRFPTQVKTAQPPESAEAYTPTKAEADALGITVHRPAVETGSPLGDRILNDVLGQNPLDLSAIANDSNNFDMNAKWNPATFGLPGTQLTNAANAQGKIQNYVKDHPDIAAQVKGILDVDPLSPDAKKGMAKLFGDSLAGVQGKPPEVPLISPSEQQHILPTPRPEHVMDLSQPVVAEKNGIRISRVAPGTPTDAAVAQAAASPSEPESNWEIMANAGPMALDLSAAAVAPKPEPTSSRAPSNIPQPGYGGSLFEPSPLNLTPSTPTPIQKASATEEEKTNAFAAQPQLTSVDLSSAEEALGLDPGTLSGSNAPTGSPPSPATPVPKAPVAPRVGYGRPLPGASPASAAAAAAGRSAAPQTPASSGGSGGSALLSAAGGGHLETQPLGGQIAVHTHDDGGVTTSYRASDGHIITIHTDANGDTNTLSG